MPSPHLDIVFLGQPCGAGTTRGVNPELFDRLRAADEIVRAVYDALPPEGRNGASYADWAGVYEPHACWRANAGQHSAGAAIDINSAFNPYIVTRNDGIPGGEKGGEALVGMRTRALAAYDRAMQFIAGAGAAADLRRRGPGESTASVWTRFKAASDALVDYLTLAIDQAPGIITRVAIENADEISDDELLATIPEGERIPLEHASVPRDQYLRVVRDYEQARIPMVVGEPSAAPERTRNPSRGFLNLQCEIVVALCDQGLRWGACDFGLNKDGSSYNGAIAHFDLENAGGYPEVHSLLRFG